MFIGSWFAKRGGMGVSDWHVGEGTSHTKADSDSSNNKTHTHTHSIISCCEADERGRQAASSTTSPLLTHEAHTQADCLLLVLLLILTHCPASLSPIMNPVSENTVFQDLISTADEVDNSANASEIQSLCLMCRKDVSKHSCLMFTWIAMHD